MTTIDYELLNCLEHFSSQVKNTTDMMVYNRSLSMKGLVFIIRLSLRFLCMLNLNSYKIINKIILVL